MKIIQTVKKLTVGILGTAILTSGLWACSNDNEAKSDEVVTVMKAKSNEYKVKSEDFLYIGIQHNEILDGIKQKMINGDIKINNLQDSSRNFIYNKVSEIYKDEKDLKLAHSLINTHIKRIPNYSETFYSYQEGNMMTTKLKFYLDKLHDKMQLNDDFELNRVIGDIVVLEDEISNDANIENSDLMKFYIASNIAKKSLEYWTDNSDEWDFLLNKNTQKVAYGNRPPRKTPGRRIGEIAIADVGGAVGGATYAWAANVFPGIGQVTYAGAIVGTAVTCSVGAGVYHMAASIFDWD